MTEMQLNSKFSTENFKKFQEAIQLDKPFESNDDLYLVDPFSVGYINDLIIMSDDYLQKILSQLKSLKMSAKSNDLYKFQQSKDFKFIKNNKTLQEIRTFFLKTILPWMKESTNIDLFDDEIDITFSSYQDSDYLLCHDDHLEARRIAFVWYLVDKDWCEGNGGHLDLISSDESGEPKQACKSFLPKHNSFVFFKVADNSYHQVREVKLETDLIDKSRISINGWFRGPNLKWKDVAVIPAPERLSPVHIEESLFFDWINNIYLNDQTAKAIRKSFVEDSEVQLPDFFNEEKFDELLKCLHEMEFKMTGPMNVMQVYLAAGDESQYPDLVREVRRLLGSEAMMVLLSDLTNLSLHGASQHDDTDDDDDEEENEEEEIKPTPCKKIKTDFEENTFAMGKLSNVEVRHWKTGCYSLLRDGDKRNKEFRLELFFSVGFPTYESEELDCGGFYSYFAEGEDEELLTVVPSNNSLSLIHADDETMGFMKYITHKYGKLFDESEGFPEKTLYDFHATYYEYE